MQSSSSSAPPTDDQLGDGFAVDTTITFETMAQQAAALGASVSTPTLLSGKQMDTSRTPTHGSTSDDAGAPLEHPTSARGGRGRGRGQQRPRSYNTRSKPSRSNQLEKLTSALSEADTDDAAPIPSEDALTTREIDVISARSSRIEDTIDDHGVQLQTANVRIAALEKENSLLLSRFTSLSREVDGIKEMLPKGSLPTIKAAAASLHKGKPQTMLAPPPSVSPAPARGGAQDLSIQATMSEKLNPGMDSRPVPKRKFIG